MCNPSRSCAKVMPHLLHGLQFFIITFNNIASNLMIVRKGTTSDISHIYLLNASLICKDECHLCSPWISILTWNVAIGKVAKVCNLNDSFGYTS